MEISYSINNNILLAVLNGELDENTAQYVRMSLDAMLNDVSCLNSAEVIVDFSNVTFMDSTGIGVLLGRYNKFRKNNIAIFIKNPQSHVDRIFKMTGIYELMPKIS